MRRIAFAATLAKLSQNLRVEHPMSRGCEDGSCALSSHNYGIEYSETELPSIELSIHENTCFIMLELDKYLT